MSPIYASSSAPVSFIVWVCAVVFAGTALAAVLSLFWPARFPPRLRRWLHIAVIVEITAAAVGTFRAAIAPERPRLPATALEQDDLREYLQSTRLWRVYNPESPAFVGTALNPDVARLLFGALRANPEAVKDIRAGLAPEVVAVQGFQESRRQLATMSKKPPMLSYFAVDDESLARWIERWEDEAVASTSMEFEGLLGKLDRQFPAGSDDARTRRARLVATIGTAVGPSPAGFRRADLYIVLAVIDFFESPLVVKLMQDALEPSAVITSERIRADMRDTFMRNYWKWITELTTAVMRALGDRIGPVKAR